MRSAAGPVDGRSGRPAQPARGDGRVPARRVHRGHRGVGLGQVHAGRRDHGGPGGGGPSGLGRPEADRPDPALQPGHLHGPVRRRAQGLRRPPTRRAHAATASGRFSFNVAGGRCETCQGEGFVSVELLFLPSTYAPCPDCGGARYNPETLEVTYRGRNIAAGARPDRGVGGGLLRGHPGGRPQPRHPPRRRPRLPAPRPARHRTLRRRGPAHQARERTPARPPRPHPLPPRRTHDRSPPGRRGGPACASSTASSTPATR